MTHVLPKSSEFGHYRLQDGSIIYCSGRESFLREDTLMKPPNPGKYMLWVCTSKPDGMVAQGYLMMAADGPMYFDSPKHAAIVLNDIITHGAGGRPSKQLQ